MQVKNGMPLKQEELLWKRRRYFQWILVKNNVIKLKRKKEQTG